MKNICFHLRVDVFFLCIAKMKYPTTTSTGIGLVFAFANNIWLLKNIFFHFIIDNVSDYFIQWINKNYSNVDLYVSKFYNTS